MWDYIEKDYSIYYGKQVVVFYKYNMNDKLKSVCGKLKGIYKPYHDICFSEISILLNDKYNHTTLVCSNLIDKIFLDITKKTHNNFNIVKPYIEKKTNSDIIYNIMQFLEYDYIEI